MYRRRALLRAMQTYRRMLTATAEPEPLCGSALLVLQRAAFCAEDLGGLLHALSSSSGQWGRLTSTTIRDLDAIYAQVAIDARAGEPARSRPSIQPFCVGPDELIESETDRSEIERAASVHLAEIYAVRWLKRMWPVASFWAEYRDVAKATMHDVAKATMHGYPMLAGARARAHGRGRPLRRSGGLG